MQKVSLRKIKSVPKRLRSVWIWTVLLVLSLVILIALRIIQDKDARDPLRVEINGSEYLLEVADSTVEQERGLSGRTSLGQQKGMIFVHDQTAERCMWMKETLIPLDMIWLDGDKRITHLQTKVDPASYPKTYCADGQYVVELAAGEAARNRLKTGQKLQF